VQAFAGICAGVRHAHQKGIVHRDLKPGNILMSRHGVPKVADFGLAAWSQPGSMDLTLTRQGELFGSPAWMPPEQARGELQDIDTLSDIHALGAVLFFLLSGRPPLDPNLAPQVLLAAAQSEDRLLLRAVAPRIPRDLAAITDKCLSGPKSRRYQSVSELEADVRRWLDGQPVQARPASVLYWTGRKLRRHWVPAAAAVAVLSSGAGWLWERVQAEYRLAEKRRQMLRQSQELAGQLLVDLSTLASRSKDRTVRDMVRKRIASFQWDPESGDDVTDPRRFVVRMAMADARRLAAGSSWASAEREWNRAAEELRSLLRDHPDHAPYLAELREVQLGLQTVLLRQGRRMESVAAGLPLVEESAGPGDRQEPSERRTVADAITNLADALCGRAESDLLGESAPEFPPGSVEETAARILRHASRWYPEPESAGAEEATVFCRHRVRVLREAARVALRFGVAGTIPVEALAKRASECGRRLVALLPGDASERLLMGALATQAEVAARKGDRASAHNLLKEAAAMVAVEPSGALPRTLSPGPAVQLAAVLFWYGDTSEKSGCTNAALWAYEEADKIWAAAHLRERGSDYLARRGAVHLHIARIMASRSSELQSAASHAQQALEFLVSAGEPYLGQNAVFRMKRTEAEHLMEAVAAKLRDLPSGTARK
jgi:hypothetical protein